MTGFRSKKTAALDEDGMYLVHQTAQPAQEPVAMLERDPSIGRLRVTYEDSVTELDEGVYPLYTKPQGWRDNVAQAYLKGFDEGCKSISVRNGDTTGRWSGKTENASKPIAWLEPEWGEKICPEVGYEVTMTDDHPGDLGWIPLYAHPPQGVPVAWQLWVGADTPLNAPMGWHFYNTYDSLRSAEVSARTINSYQQSPFAKVIPLYTTPPQREWVGLTDEEMQAVVDAQLLVSNINVYFKAIEAKLKEKNNG